MSTPASQSPATGSVSATPSASPHAAGSGAGSGVAAASGAAGTTPPVALDDPSLYINRELSWLEFNQRVLEEAGDATVPILERLKFVAISASNLDEFFMVRVAGVKQQLAGGVVERSADGLAPAETLARISQRAQKMVAEQYRLLRHELMPGLAQVGLKLLVGSDLNAEQRKLLSTHYTNQIYPALTPLAIDPGHPFPHLRNRTLNLAIALDRGGQQPHSASRPSAAGLAVVQVPAVLGRFVEVPVPASDKVTKKAYVLLEDVIAIHLGDLFPGTRILGVWPFRVTRNFDINYDEDESADLLKTIQKEVRRRDRGNAVRLEIAQGADPGVRRFLAETLRLSPEDVYSCDGPLQLSDLMSLYAGSLGVDLGRDTRDEPGVAQLVPKLRDAATTFEAVAQGDILVQHPYESFEHVSDFIEEAADDPHVLAIKQTLYRTSGDSPIVKALARAAEAGKQVTALVELKARFDEENNIAWARALEEAGVHVVYGLIGLKTHCKLALVVRREGQGIRRYVHLSTGNYNNQTARLYTDISFFTCRDAFGDDATALFNLLTGYSQPASWKRFVVAPMNLHDTVLAMIEREADNARAGRPAHIVAKLNALVDGDVIQALYRASQSGVKIDLLVRGICCLRAGVPGVSDNIRVQSVIDRYLEHSRILYFHAGGKDEVYLASADWMPRNFQRRVELLFPIEDLALKARLKDEILGIMLADNVKTRVLQPDGSYVHLHPQPGSEAVRSQVRFAELARQRAAPPTVDLRLRPALMLRPQPGSRRQRELQRAEALAAVVAAAQATSAPSAPPAVAVAEPAVQPGLPGVHATPDPPK